MNYGKPEDFVELKAQRQRQMRHGDAEAAPWAIEDFGDYESGRGADKVGSVCCSVSSKIGGACFL